MRVARLFISIVFLVIFLSCSRNVYEVMYPTLQDGKYDSEFPYRACSEELDTISRSVIKVMCTTQYQSFIFTDERYTADEITSSILKRADYVQYFSNNTIGTGTIILQNPTRMAILTCSHIFDRPDTLIYYFSGTDSTKDRYVRSVSIKRQQHNIAPELFKARGDYLEFLIFDRDQDVAILSKTFEPDESPLAFQALPYPFGRAKELEWGSFVYLFGYPKGIKALTKGIVSQPDYRKDAFLIDASFNRGMSGGLILAVRDGVPNFELAGMATSAFTDTDELLIPHEQYRSDPRTPYTGESYITTMKRINYGLSIVITSETILDLIRAHLDDLYDQGYDFSHLFKEESEE